MRINLSECTNILDSQRIPLSSNERELLNKIYPYYGAQGIIDYVDRYIFDGQFILVAEDGNNLKSLAEPIATWAEGKFWVNNHAHILGKKDGYCLKYIYYVLNSLDLRGYITGSAQPKFNQQNLAKVTMDLPDYDTQCRIAKTLSTIDDKISNNNRINAELESMAKTIYDYWFTQFDFPDENGKPYKSSGGKIVWNEELKREIPEGWGVGKLSDLCELINGRAYSQNELQDSGKYRILRVGNFFTNNSWYYSDMELEEDKYAIAGDLLYCWSASFGPSIWNYEKVIYHYHIWKVKCPEYNKLYVYELMKELTSQFVKSTHGSIMLHLTKDGMEKQTVLIPEHTVLQQFSNALSPIFEKIRINENENQQLASLRDWLLPMLMNGQVGVEGE